MTTPVETGRVRRLRSVVLPSEAEAVPTESVHSERSRTVFRADSLNSVNQQFVSTVTDTCFLRVDYCHFLIINETPLYTIVLNNYYLILPITLLVVGM